MANKLNEDLTGRPVVLKKNVWGCEDYRFRVFQCNSGPGCKPTGKGKEIEGEFVLDGTTLSISSDDIERFTDEEKLETVSAHRYRAIMMGDEIYKLVDEALMAVRENVDGNPDLIRKIMGLLGWQESSKRFDKLLKNMDKVGEFVWGNKKSTGEIGQS